MTESGFADFVADRQGALLRFAMVLTGDAWASEDIVAEVLARAYERWPRIAPLEHPSAYVRRMVVNEFLSRARVARRASQFRDTNRDRSVVADPASDHAERAAMLAALARLPRRQRATLVLRYYEGLSDAEVAELLCCAPSTVRSNTARALAALRIHLSDSSEPHRIATAGEI